MRNLARTRFKRFRMFDLSTPKNVSRRKIRMIFFVFCQFGVDVDELRRKGRQRKNQLPGQILLQIDQVAVGNVPLRAQVAAQRKGYRKKVCLSLKGCGVPRHIKIESGGSKIEPQTLQNRGREPSKSSLRRFKMQFSTIFTSDCVKMTTRVSL